MFKDMVLAITQAIADEPYLTKAKVMTGASQSVSVVSLETPPADRPPESTLLKTALSGNLNITLVD